MIIKLANIFRAINLVMNYRIGLIDGLSYLTQPLKIKWWVFCSWSYEKNWQCLLKINHSPFDNSHHIGTEITEKKRFFSSFFLSFLCASVTLWGIVFFLTRGATGTENEKHIFSAFSLFFSLHLSSVTLCHFWGKRIVPHSEKITTIPFRSYFFVIYSKLTWK